MNNRGGEYGRFLGETEGENLLYFVIFENFPTNEWTEN